MINRAKTYNYNMILPEVRLRGNCYYFPTYPNTEPRATDIAGDYDPLQDMIDQAHAEGIEVHAWIVLQLVANSIPSDPAHVVNAHPEYLTEDSSGSNEVPDYDLDTGHPDANLWNYNVIMDLVTNYDIDGMHFDHCRMHQQDSGYNPVSIARYNAEYGLSGKPGQSDSQFIEWRRRQLTNFLRATYVDIKAVKPGMVVTAATSSRLADSLNHYFQDWPTWMQDKVIDANCPMLYTTSNTTFQDRLDTIYSHKYTRQLYIGTGNYLNTKENMVTQVGLVRDKGCEGVIFYSYAFPDSTGSQDPVFQYYKDNLFPTVKTVPTIGWISNPTDGYLRGGVYDTSSGDPIDIATVTILGLGDSINTEGDGKYSFIEVAPGTYTIRCEASGYTTEDIPGVSISAGSVATQDFFMGEGPTPTPTPTPTETPTPTPSPTPTPTPTPTPEPGDVYVNDIAMSYKAAGPNISGLATVWIKNDSDEDVEGATVYGDWTGCVTGSSQGVTEVDGKVTLESPKKNGGGTYNFCVTDVVAAGYIYNEAMNVETCDSITEPPAGPTPTPTPTPTSTPTETPTPTPTPTPTGTPSGKVYVNDIAMSYKAAGPNINAIATVWIKNDSGGDVEDATVYGEWTGVVTGSSEGTTGSDGKVELTSPKKNGGGTFNFCVTDVVASGYTYDEGMNVETCDSITYP